MRLRELAGCVAAAIVVAGLSVAVAPAGASDPVTVNVSDAMVVEPDSGFVIVKVAVDLSAALASTVRVPYTIAAAPDGVTDSADAVFRSGRITFLAGKTTALIQVQVYGDTHIEADQHVRITLGTPLLGTAVLGQSIGTVTIVDNDADGIETTNQVSIGDVIVRESDTGTHNAFLSVTLARPATATIVLSFRIGCGNATATIGSSPAQGKITFQIGQQYKFIQVVIAANFTEEDLQGISQTIRSAVGPANIFRPNGTAYIVDDDGETLPPPIEVGQIEQLSISTDGTPAQYPIPEAGNGYRSSERVSVSDDGSAAAFLSSSCSLIAGDTNGIRDVYVRDRVHETTKRISRKADGSEISAAQAGQIGWGTTFVAPQVSGNGRYVAWTSEADLVPEDTNNGYLGSNPEKPDVYVYDLQTDTQELVSVMPDGTSAGGVTHSWSPSISDDGRYVAFTVNDEYSALTNFTGETVYSRTTFVRDRVAGTTTLVRHNGFGQLAISGNGRYVVQAGYELLDGSDPENPVYGNDSVQIHDLFNGTNERVDVTSSGDPAEGGLANTVHALPSVSDDGRYVVFKSVAWNLFGYSSPPATGAPHYSALMRVYIRDRVADTTTKIATPLDSSWPISMSDDASTLAISSGSQGQGFTVDAATGTTTPFGIPYQPGADNNIVQTAHGLSGDGNYVAFYTESWPFGDVYIQRLS